MAKSLVLVYALPSARSAPRVALWRALKELPGGYLRDGVYAAPATRWTRLALEHLAHDIRNEGGKAWLLDAGDLDGLATQPTKTKAAKRRQAPNKPRQVRRP